MDGPLHREVGLDTTTVSWPTQANQGLKGIKPFILHLVFTRHRCARPFPSQHNQHALARPRGSHLPPCGEGREGKQEGWVSVQHIQLP